MATITVTSGLSPAFISGDTVTPAKLNSLGTPTVALTAGSIVNADVSASAAIAFSKLASLDSANILVGNASNVATKVAVTGDVTISNAGVTAIGSAKVLPAMLSQPFTLATSQASTSGTSIDFTGIPSWAKRITLMFDGVSLSGTSNILAQLGDSGGFETSGYVSTAYLQTNVLNTSTQGFVLNGSGTTAAMTRRGHIFLTNISANGWVMSGLMHQDGGGQSAFVSSCAGSKSLSDTLTQVRITTVNGTDTFDAGTINISYEG